MARACSSLALCCLFVLVPCMVMAAGTPAGTSIDNQATVVYSAADTASRYVVYGNRISFTISQRAVVNLGPATGTKSVRLGEMVDYPFTVTNSGNGADRFALGALSSLGLRAEIYGDADRNGTLSASEIGAGALTITGTLPADSSAAFIVRLHVGTDTALSGRSDLLAVKATSQYDAARSAAGVFTTEIKSALLVLTMAVSNPTPQVSSRVTYTIRCANAGSARAENVVITDLVHPKLHYITGSSTPAADTVLGQEMTWKLGSLEPGADTSIAFVVEIDESLATGMAVHNEAVAAYEDGATDRAARSTELSFITIAAGGVTTVTIGPDGVATGECGDTVQYALVVTNTGGLPKEYELSAASSRGVRWTFTLDSNANGRIDDGERQVTTTGVIPAGSSRHFLAGGRLPAVAVDSTKDTTLFAARSTVNRDNAAQCTARTVIERPVMTLQKSVDMLSAPAGADISYTIAYANRGSGRAERFRVTDTLPANTSFVAGSIRLNSVPKTEAADADEVTIANGVLSVELGTVAPDTSGRIEFTVRIN